jgi:hypothetical protein
MSLQMHFLKEMSPKGAVLSVISLLFLFSLMTSATIFTPEKPTVCLQQAVQPKIMSGIRI